MDRKSVQSTEREGKRRRGVLKFFRRNKKQTYEVPEVGRDE